MDALRYLISWIFPPSEEELLIAALSPASLTALTKPQTHAGVLSLVPYTDARIRAVLWQAKYRNDARAFSLIADVLDPVLRTYDTSLRIVPIPLSKRRAHERGYNQIEEVLGRCGSATGRVAPVLERIRETMPQTHLPRATRLTNLVGAFTVPTHARETVRGNDFILVDDVCTTGATLHEAKRALTQAGARTVHCIAFARS